MKNHRYLKVKKMKKAFQSIKTEGLLEEEGEFTSLKSPILPKTFCQLSEVHSSTTLSNSSTDKNSRKFRLSTR